MRHAGRRRRHRARYADRRGKDVSEAPPAATGPGIRRTGRSRPAGKVRSVLGLDKFDLGEIATALQDQTDYERCYLVDPATGKIEFWTRDCGIDGQNPIELDELDHLL